MKQIRFSEITVADIRTIAHVDEKDIEPYPWTQVDAIALSSEEQRQLNDITTRLRYYDVTLMNEATIWARAIYPLLMLAEQRPIQAWSQVPLRAQYPHIELQGIVDGVLGRGINNIAGTTYYLLIVEAKRGLESQDPRLALYGQILAAARLNWESTRQDTQALYGCYTIVDTWKFFRAVVQDIDSENPTMLLEASREYGQKTHAEAILKLLKHIVASFGQNQEQP